MEEYETGTAYYWSWKPLTYNNELLSFGFPLFGWWLPYVGFTSIDGYKGVLLEWWLRGVFFVWGLDDKD